MSATALHGSDLSVFAGGLILFCLLLVAVLIVGVGYRKLADRIARWRNPRPGYVHPYSEPLPSSDEVWDWPVREREPH